MATVKVEMMGALKAASGEEEMKLVSLSEGDVAGVIQRLIDEYGVKLEAVLLDPLLRSPRPNVLILLNGVEVYNLEGLGTPVVEGDVVTFLPITHCG